MNNEKNKKNYWINRRDILVTGYIRKKHPKLPKDIILMIINWTFINDLWQNINNNKDMMITNNQQTIERISKCSRNCYYGFGHEIITKSSYKQMKKWKIKINKIEYLEDNDCSLLIGIIESKKINWIKSNKFLGDFTYGVYGGYALKIASNKSYFVHKHKKQLIYLENGKFKKNDIISIKLDLSNKNITNNHNKNPNNTKYGKLKFKFKENDGTEIKYGLNSEYKWENTKYTIFNNIDINKKYNLIIGMYCRDKITFIESYNINKPRKKTKY